MRQDFCVKFEFQREIIEYRMSLLKYAMRDLICDVNYCAWPATLRYGSKSVSPFFSSFHASVVLTIYEIDS